MGVHGRRSSAGQASRLAATCEGGLDRRQGIGPLLVLGQPATVASLNSAALSFVKEMCRLSCILAGCHLTC